MRLIQRRKRRSNLEIFFKTNYRIVLGILAVLLALTTPYLITANAAGVGTVTNVSSGLIHQDALTSSKGPDTSYWRFSGDAPQEGAQYDYKENVSGLYVGVDSPAPSVWAGFYAESPNSNVLLFHSVLTLLYPSLTHDSFNTGLYVQTSNGLINYVTCAASVSSTSGYLWEVVSATGNTSQATNFTTLWSQFYSSTDKADLIQDCTIVTNGSNMLRVYLNAIQVYSSTNAGLNMPEPFNAYLEVETSHGGNNLLYGKYTDYYATLSDTLTVQNVPSGDTAEIVSSGGSVLASGAPSSSGVASITIGTYHMPISGSIKIVSGGIVVAATGAMSVWGGDVYQMGVSSSSSSSSSSSPTSTSTTTAASIIILSYTQNNQPINGVKTALFHNGVRLATGHTPVTFSALVTGETYKVKVDNTYGGCTFKQWQDTGSTSSSRTFSASASQTFTAVYHC